MPDPFVSLVSSFPTLQKQIARSTGPLDYTCSVTKIGEWDDFEKWSGPVARQLVTIGYLDGHQGLGEEPLQTILATLLRELGHSDVMGDVKFHPLVAVLERSSAGACYTILCCFQDEKALERLDWTTQSIFEGFLSEIGLAADCLRVATMSVSAVDELTHLLIRTVRRNEKPHPIRTP